MLKIGVLNRYKKNLPVTGKTPLITMGEGDTPLIKCDNLAREIGVGQLHLKFEGCNPTGSFKDRGMVVAVAKAMEAGSKAIMCASTGNTSASAAAYAAYCGLASIIVVPEGKIALGKLAQAIIYGAKILAIEGNFDQALNIVRTVTQKHPVTLVNSVNPFRIEGQKTAAFEVADILGDAPDYLFIPVGNAGNITAYWAGFKQYHGIKSTGLPQVLGVQAAGAAPLVLGHPVENPETVATAIRIGKPARGEQALEAAEQSGGRIIAVSDDEIIAMQKKLAALEGIWVEPASAAGLAGLAHEIASGRLDPKGRRIVAVCTGHGLKDPDIVTMGMDKPKIIPPKLDALEEVILG